ncbi:transglutaminase domain-containing protein [Halobacterium yunchengense]|uniref:transglutaminase domain-containing protein n=1 Tax=Halobacterium yunchengense TaxID=3108497 RepID=UPI00300899B3
MSDAPGPDARRALLAVVCVLGLVAASTAAPALSSQAPLGGLDQPPAPSEVPSFARNLADLQSLLGQPDAQSRVDGASALGALSPGQSASVGGALSAEQQRDAATPHFVAEAAGDRYWRTDAYTTYTGSGWTQEPVNRVQAPRPIDTREASWSEVTLRRPASKLPTPWRPVDIDQDCGDAIPCSQEYDLTAASGIEATPPLEAGATYRVQSVSPPADAATLSDSRVAGSVTDTEYSTVQTTDRVRETAERVVGDAENRYEAAERVEAYLESEKNYSLTDVPEPGSNVADEFLFEQSAGYCEYFATTMAVMLRSQDVPARYVVGYAGGEYVGDGDYLVRGADAHAWVEVYFEDVGWVRFDPTPSDERSDARDALHSEDPDFRVALNRTAVPGERVTANVTAAGVPASDVALVVNGDRVGRTDERGQVEFVVPYAEELRVSVDTTVNLTDAGSAVATPTAASAPSSMPSSVLSSGSTADAAFSVGEPSFGGQSATGAATTQADGEDNETVQRIDVSSDVQFAFEGDAEPGARRTLEARVAGKPFAGATVSVEGVEQGVTGEDGRVTVEIPADASGVVAVTASRGELSETATYPVEALSVSVSPSLVAPLPGAEATARVTAGGEAVADAPVTVAGERVGATDEGGRVGFEIPWTRAPAVAASASGKHATAYVDGVLPSAALAALLAAGALAAVTVAASRRGVTLALVLAVAGEAARRAVSAAVGALVGLADAVDELAAEFREAARDGWRGVLAWLASLPGRVSLPDVRAWAASVVAAARAATNEDQTAGQPPAADAGADAGAGSLQAVWRRFVGVVGVERWETKTPGEVAREAVRRGFPRRPVYAVTGAFRDAAYGGRPAASGLERASDALDALRGGADGVDGADVSDGADGAGGTDGASDAADADDERGGGA